MVKKTQRSYNSTLRSKSKKQIAEDKIWVALGDARLEKQVQERCYTFCEDCGTWGERNLDGFRRLDYHHKDENRRNNTDENLKVLHREPCHRRYKDPDAKTKYIIGADPAEEVR